ncbi:MAG: sulfatase [Bacteroidota bacterium]
MFKIIEKLVLGLCLGIIFTNCQQPQPDLSGTELQKIENAKPMNVVFILSDDHRYDFMGFTGKVPFLKTPNMDRMALDGTHVQNAFVTTSLCSPSRASILTGQFSHHHGVVDNQSLVPDSAVFFPEYLQQGGYRTGFIGKWHMGEHTYEKREGFDYWASFRGQGKYYKSAFNKNGVEEVFNDSSQHVSDVITDYALEFLEESSSWEKPFFLYVSHKAVHADFYPAKRHIGTYKNEKPAYPPSMFPPGENPHGTDTIEYNYADVPDWVKKQRNSWHGVDYMYHGKYNFEEFYQAYTETLLGIDESIGRILSYLEQKEILDNTLVFYMGDNGFSFGEHGLIDKRQAYEESIRVPLLLYGGKDVLQNPKVEQMIQNIDIAPTVLELAGLKKPDNMDGESFLPILKGKNPEWRERIYYEYFWERPFPQTPTVHAVRTNKYKYIRYYGVWDINELYDLENDPWEMNNLIRSEEHREIAKDLRNDLFAWLEKTNGMNIPLRHDGQGARFDHLYRGTY